MRIPFFQHPLQAISAKLNTRVFNLGIKAGLRCAERHADPLYYNTCEICGSSLASFLREGIPYKGCPNRFDNRHRTVAGEMLEVMLAATQPSLPRVMIPRTAHLRSVRDVARAAHLRAQPANLLLPAPPPGKYISVRELLEG